MNVALLVSTDTQRNQSFAKPLHDMPSLAPHIPTHTTREDEFTSVMFDSILAALDQGEHAQTLEEIKTNPSLFPDTRRLTSCEQVSRRLDTVIRSLNQPHERRVSSLFRKTRLINEATILAGKVILFTITEHATPSQAMEEDHSKIKSFCVRYNDHQKTTDETNEQYTLTRYKMLSVFYIVGAVYYTHNRRGDDEENGEEE